MAFRVAASDTAPNTTSIDINGSALTGLQIGDVMIAGILYRDNVGNITPPSGWTSFGPTQEVRTADGVSIVANLRAYRRVAQTGDDSAVFTWNFVIAQTHIGIIAAFSGRNTSAPITASAGFSNTTSQATIDAPDVSTATGDDILQFAGSGKDYNWTVSGGGLVEIADVIEGAGGDASLVAAAENTVAAGTYTAGTYTSAEPSAWTRFAALSFSIAAAPAGGGASGSRNMLLMGAG